MRLGIVDDGDRGIFLKQLRERLAQLDVVLALLGGDRDAQNRRMGSDLRNRRLRRLAVRQAVTALGMIKLAEFYWLAGFGRAALVSVLPDNLKVFLHPSRFAPGVHERR